LFVFGISSSSVMTLNDSSSMPDEKHSQSELLVNPDFSNFLYFMLNNTRDKQVCMSFTLFLQFFIVYAALQLCVTNKFAYCLLFWSSVSRVGTRIMAHVSWHHHPGGKR
jgi:hypothetical protein